MAESKDPLDLARSIARAYRPAGAAEPPRRRRRATSPSVGAEREDAVPVAGMLQEFVEQQGWQAALASSRVYTEWDQIVGAQVAQHSQVDHFEGGIVHVRTSSTAWAKELTLLAPTIVARLNEALGDGLVQRIEVRGPQAPSWSAGPRSVKGRGPRDTYG